MGLDGDIAQITKEMRNLLLDANLPSSHSRPKITTENYSKEQKRLLQKEMGEIIERYSKLDVKNISLFKIIGRIESTFFWVFKIPQSWRVTKGMLQRPAAKIEFYEMGSYKSTVYTGNFVAFDGESVLITFDSESKEPKILGNRFEVKVIPNLITLIRCSNAVEDKSNLDVMFPESEKASAPLNDLVDIKYENSGLDASQKRAVINVLRGECRPAPYIIFGPPGTGKTVTLVECVVQALQRNPNCKILVCGNSNACADNIACRLIKGLKDNFDTDEYENQTIGRYVAKDRMAEAPKELKKIMQWAPADLDCPSHSIVVSTCNTAARFGGQFDYVFIDEAGHALEADVKIAINRLSRRGLCVLAGDPYQLPPVVQSREAEEEGLGISILERLFEREVYKPDRNPDGKPEFDKRYITKLTCCRRSDSRIMEPSNRLFYDDEIVCPSATPSDLLRALNLGSPRVFCEVQNGCEERWPNSTSRHNPAEARACLRFALKLINKTDLVAEEIGVIAIYKDQVKSISEKFLSEPLLDGCKVATVDEFQGQERRVILVSTVRTIGHGMKFVFDEKRFNVAVSRAKHLIVVFGASGILRRDRCWLQYISRAHFTAGY